MTLEMLCALSVALDVALKVTVILTLVIVGIILNYRNWKQKRTPATDR